MKLLFLTQNQGPFRMKWMDELAKYMEVKIFHINEYEDGINPQYIDYKLKRASISDISIKMLNKKIYNIKRVLDEKYDFLVLDGYGFIAQQLLLLVLIIFGKPYFLNVDGGFVSRSESWFKKKIKEIYIKNAKKIFSTSKDTDSFLTYYGANKNQIIRHYLSNFYLNDIREKPLDREGKNSIRKTYGWPMDKFIFLAVGRFIPSKGFDLLAEALEQMPENVQIYIVGKNNDEEVPDYLKKHNITCLPFVDKKQLNNYFDAADVFVLPTRYDVWGLVIGEAMSRGMPVITTYNCMAGKAMVKNGRNGYLTEVAHDSLHDAMMKIMENNLEQFGQCSINVAKRFSIEESARNDYYNLLKTKEL